MLSLSGLGGHLVSVIILGATATNAQRPALNLADVLLSISNSDYFSISTEIKGWEGGRNFKCRKHSSI